VGCEEKIGRGKLDTKIVPICPCQIAPPSYCFLANVRLYVPSESVVVPGVISHVCWDSVLLASYY
jgi:hypothetical protein